MEAMTVYVCPICSMAFTTVPVSHTPPPTRELCMGIPVGGTWVPEEGWPALIMIDGMVHRIYMSPESTAAMQSIVAEPVVPDEDRQTVVKPEDGDDRYWDDEQEKLRR